MQTLYAYYKHSGEASINTIEKELFFSVKKSYDLYHYLLLLPIDIANYAQKRIELAQNKKIPTHADLNPNSRFVDNLMVQQLRINNPLLRYLEINKLNWVNNPELIKGLYEQLIESTFYADYLNSENNSYQADKTFLVKFYKEIVAAYEPLYGALEEQSIFWNDEVEFIIGAIIKTIKKFQQSQAEDAELLPLYKNEEDKEFTKTLFRKVILNQDTYKKLIEDFSENWDFERIAFIDILLIEMAVAEVLEFKSIPVKVTYNEYIELSKFYSTNRSNVFINGMLDKIFNHLKKTNQIQKQGRGLIGEV